MRYAHTVRGEEHLKSEKTGFCLWNCKLSRFSLSRECYLINSLINTFWRKCQLLQPKSEARLRDNCTDLFWQSSATKISSRPRPIKSKYFLHIFRMSIITAITNYIRAVLLALSGMNMAGENMTFISIFIKLLFSTVLIHSKYRKIPQWNRP